MVSNVRVKSIGTHSAPPPPPLSLKDVDVIYGRPQRRSHIAEDYVSEEIHLNCTDGKSLVPGTSASNKLSRFFDKVCIFKVFI